jgi:HlyD family secretion protein
MKRLLIVLAVIGSVAGAGAYYVRHDEAGIVVTTAAVTRGDVVDAIAATGTLQAVNTVQVGSQVSGTIQSLGADFNSIVKKGQIIARLDPSLLNAQLEQSRASLIQARANLEKSRSDLQRNMVQLEDARQKFARANELGARSLLPQSELDTARIAVETAQANVGSQEATVIQAQAGVTQAEASVSQSQLNLDRSVITAPIDGIVIQRSVDVGQTVAASMAAPTLFVIAADLGKMQVNASIDESDVGRIQPGQTTTFRVDAYPGQQFEGRVSQVRLQPVVVQNVTTYEAIIDVSNPDLLLKPGMTANLRVEVARRNGVLRIPNAALRFRPTTEMFAALEQPRPTENQPAAGRRAWLYLDNVLKPVTLGLGITDGINTEMLSGGLEAGAMLATGVVATAPRASTAGGTANPLMGPQRSTGGPGRGF